MTLLSGLMVAVGLVGVVVPVLPGLVLVWAGVLVWALGRHSAVGWTVLAVASALAVAGSVVKYLLPGRQLRDSGVPWPTLAAGTVLAVVGFFAVPVVGLFAGFVIGVYGAERVRLHEHAAAWPSTLAALRAVGWSLAIELATALAVTATWGVGLWAG